VLRFRVRVSGSIKVSAGFSVRVSVCVLYECVAEKPDVAPPTESINFELECFHSKTNSETIPKP